MDPLKQLLGACEALLRSVEEEFWANKVQVALKKLEIGAEPYLLDEILSWYGGMGSFNDLIISEYNQHSVEREDEGKLNDELNFLRTHIYQEVKRLKTK